MQDGELLQDTLHLWVASRLIEKPWRVAGNETLEHNVDDILHPFWDKESPYFSHVPVTPVMDNQLDQIIIQAILLPRKKSIQKRLHDLVKSNKPSNWFLIYLCTFLLLNNYEIATSHDRNFASRHSLKVIPQENLKTTTDSTVDSLLKLSTSQGISRRSQYFACTFPLLLQREYSFQN